MVLNKAFCVLFFTLCLLGYSDAGRRRACAFLRRYRDANNVNFDANSCQYGWEVDQCGVKTCTKGPGELCGGKHMRYGICGEGLMCSNCHRCYGCSLKTFECFEDSTCNYFMFKRRRR